MTKFLKPTLGLAVATSLLFSCDNFKVTQESDGSKYQIHEGGDGKRKAKEGDILTFDLVIKAQCNHFCKCRFIVYACTTTFANRCS